MPDIVKLWQNLVYCILYIKKYLVFQMTYKGWHCNKKINNTTTAWYCQTPLLFSACLTRIALIVEKSSSYFHFVIFVSNWWLYFFYFYFKSLPFHLFDPGSHLLLKMKSHVIFSHLWLYFLYFYFNCRPFHLFDPGPLLLKMKSSYFHFVIVLS